MNQQSIFNHFLFILFLTTYINGFSQNTNHSDTSEKYRIVTFYTWGLPSRSRGGDSCESAIKKKMGFKEVRRGGCIPPRNYKKLERHNKKSERKMIRRHDTDWRNKYYDEVRKCKGI
jgi:hypothetical protein